MSKPKLRADLRKSEVVQIRFRPEEIARIKRQARIDGDPYVSNWVRNSVMKMLDKHTTDC